MFSNSTHASAFRPNQVVSLAHLGNQGPQKQPPSWVVPRSTTLPPIAPPTQIKAIASPLETTDPLERKFSTMSKGGTGSGELPTIAPVINRRDFLRERRVPLALDPLILSEQSPVADDAPRLGRGRRRIEDMIQTAKELSPKLSYEERRSASPQALKIDEVSVGVLSPPMPPSNKPSLTEKFRGMVQNLKIQQPETPSPEGISDSPPMAPKHANPHACFSEKERVHLHIEDASAFYDSPLEEVIPMLREGSFVTGFESQPVASEDSEREDSVFSSSSSEEWDRFSSGNVSLTGHPGSGDNLS